MGNNKNKKGRRYANPHKKSIPNNVANKKDDTKIESHRKAETGKHGKGSQDKDEVKVGTFRGLVKLTKQLIQNVKDIKKVTAKKSRKQKREDKLAIILTIIVVIIIGIVLWNIPATNSWIRTMTADDPIVNWIFR